MSTIVTRAGKGSALTHNEVDANFTNLNTDKIEAAQSVTLTNKTISLGSNTISGTTAQFNTALTDGDFSTLAGSETLINKTISGSNNTLSNIGNSSLTNSSVTIGSTSVSLGSTATTVSGLTLSSPMVSGGTINNASVGATTPSTGSFTSLTDSGNLTFTGTGNRITGDFSNATVANRVSFQDSTTNNGTYVQTLPNGTSQGSGVIVFNNSTPTNAAYMALTADATTAQVNSSITGTGTYLPMTFYTGGSERMRIDTSGNVGIGTSSPAVLLHAQSTTATTNAVTQALRIDSQSSGTPANGIGVGMQFATETAAGNTEIGATIEAITTDVTAASEDFDLSFKTMAAGAAAAERVRIKSTGDFQFNSGYGSVATAYGCRAWVNFNGTGTVAIRASGNVSSITDNGVGQYTVNFTTVMPDVNYSYSGMIGSPAANTGGYFFVNSSAAPTTSALAVRIITDGGTSQDVTYAAVNIFR